MNNPIVQKLNHHINNICKYKTEELLSQDLLNHTNIQKYREVFDALISDAHILDGIKLGEIVYDDEVFSEFLSVTSKIQSLFERVSMLNSNNYNIENEYQNVSKEIESIFKTYITCRPNFMELISISTGNRFNVFIDVVRKRKSNVDNEYKSFREIKNIHLNEMAEAKVKVVEESEAASEKLKQTIKDQDAITKSKLVSKYGDFFQDKADDFRINNAKKSLVASVSIGIFIILISFSIPILKITGVEIIDGLGGLYPFIATKVTVLAVLFIFLNLSIKSYKVARHNIVVNENKHLALKTFEMFASHTQDEKTRDIVLITANNLIYSDINTGYLSQDSNSSYQENVLEMIKNFNKK